jgi:hypothetical protein
MGLASSKILIEQNIKKQTGPGYSVYVTRKPVWGPRISYVQIQGRVSIYPTSSPTVLSWISPARRIIGGLLSDFIVTCVI